MVLTTEMLRRQYCNYANPLDKIKRDVDKGILIRLNRGIYETDSSVNPCLLAARREAQAGACARRPADRYSSPRW